SSSPGQFVVRCKYSHTNMDDPIVFPGQPGASHMHDFFGNKTTDAASTLESMLAGRTTCRAASDTAGYWTPTPFLNGRQIRPTVMRIYYIGGGGTDIETIPAGLQMIGGDKLAQSPDENPHVRWYCGRRTDVATPIMAAPYDCSPWRQYTFVDGVVAIIDLPSCWDGTGLRPEDVAYRVGGGCPYEFPHVLPRLSERLHLGVMNPLAADGTMGLTLSSGPYWTMHADFWNTWQQERLDELVAQCIDAGVHCGSIDALVEEDWTVEFGTSRYDLATAAATDQNGVVVAGFTNLALPGQTFHHRSDVFVRQISSDGGARWTTQFGGSGTDQALAVAAGSDGVYVAGFTDGPLPKQPPIGGQDAFVAKLGPMGKVLWIRRFGTRSDEQATSIAVMPKGVIVGGWTSGSLAGGRNGAKDAFVARFGFSGTLTWSRQFGGPGDDAVAGLAADGSKVFAVGSTAGGVHGPSEGGIDGFIRKLGAGGNALWTRQLGTVGDDAFTAVAALPGQLYVAGSTTGAFRGETSAGGSDVVIFRTDRSGIPVWTNQFGSTADDDASALMVNENGAYVVGSALGALPGETALGESDAFAAKFTRSGAQIWARQFGTGDYDRAYGGALEPDGMYVVGTTHGVFEGQVNAGDRDVFVTRLRFT
ncbi:MAG: DUF1996 domain-containing protein, partial [Actinomycetota bacterium]|nr:DUF1996 domain-containing protein [Actinomycetota bacterium]